MIKASLGSLSSFVRGGFAFDSLRFASPLNACPFCIGPYVVIETFFLLKDSRSDEFSGKNGVKQWKTTWKIGDKTCYFSQLFKKNFEMVRKMPPKKVWKGGENAFFRDAERWKSQKTIFFRAEYQCVVIKSKKKCVGGEQPYRKNTIFALPIERETGRPVGKRGRRLGQFIERMEGCSKYSRIFLRDSQAIKSGQTKNRKKLIRMESLILAQDERWRQA